MAILVPLPQGLVETVHGAVTQAFAALSDFLQPVKLERYGQPQYDSATGMLQDFAADVEDLSVLIVDYEASKVDEEVIQRDDQQVLIERSSVQGPDITTDDRIRVGGVLLRVIDVSVDPSGGLYVLQARAGGSDSA